MKKILFILFCCITSVIIAQNNTKIFNGKDLTGWTVHGTEKWYVDNGELVCESGPDKQYGYLSTNNFYKNFILTLKFKQEANGNSGVFFRSGIDGIKISGWQVEVAPKGHNTAGIYESYGRGWLLKPKPEDEKILKRNKLNFFFFYSLIKFHLNQKAFTGIPFELTEQKMREAFDLVIKALKK